MNTDKRRPEESDDITGKRIAIKVTPGFQICYWASRRTDLVVYVDRFLWVMAAKNI